MVVGRRSGQDPNGGFRLLLLLLLLVRVVVVVTGILGRDGGGTGRGQADETVVPPCDFGRLFAFVSYGRRGSDVVQAIFEGGRRRRSSTDDRTVLQLFGTTPGSTPSSCVAPRKTLRQGTRRSCCCCLWIVQTGRGRSGCRRLLARASFTTVRFGGGGGGVKVRR